MSAVDKVKVLSTIAPPAGSDNVRATTQGDNNKRTERYQLRVTGQVDVTVAGSNVLNKGSILAALTDIGFSDGGTDKIVLDARLARFIAEAMAPSALPATRMTTAAIQAATQLEEIVPLFMSAYKTGNLNETKFVEVNKQLQQQPFITPLRTIGRLVNGAPTGTITNLQATVEQVYDDLVQTPPWLSPYTRQVVQDVAGANAALKVDLRGSRYLRGIAIQQDSDLGEVNDIIQNLVLRGDRDTYWGQQGIPLRDLLLAQAYENGGSVQLGGSTGAGVTAVMSGGYLWIDFCRYGRLSTMWNPYQDTNLRLELGVVPSAFGVTGSKIRVAMVEYERTAATAAELPITI